MIIVIAIYPLSLTSFREEEEGSERGVLLLPSLRLPLAEEDEREREREREGGTDEREREHDGKRGIRQVRTTRK